MAVRVSVSSKSAHWFPSVPRKTFSPPQLPQRMITSFSSISPQYWHEYDIIKGVIMCVFYLAARHGVNLEYNIIHNR